MSAQPWKTDHWSVSPHNFDADVAVEPHRVELHDITIRDGEECADLAYNVDDKVRIAEALAATGLKRTELFLTGPGWLEAVRAILDRQLPLDLYVDWNAERVVIIEFVDMYALKRWHDADEYQPLIKLRQSAAQGDMVALNGLG